MNVQDVTTTIDEATTLQVPVLQASSLVKKGKVSQRSGRPYGKWTRRFSFFRRARKDLNQMEAASVGPADSDDVATVIDEQGFVAVNEDSQAISGRVNPMTLSFCDASDCHDSVKELCLALGNDIPPQVAPWDGSLQMLIEYALQSRRSISTAEVLHQVIRNNDHCSRTRNETNGTFLLHLACRYNAPLDIVQLLLEQNPNAILVVDGKGMLPLHNACSNTDISLEAIQLLLKHYPESIRSQTANQAYPLHVAIDFHASLEVIKYLVEQDSSIVKQKDGIGRLPLHCACSGILQTWNHDVVLLLLNKYPKSLQVSDNFGALPLHDVAQTIAKREAEKERERATTQVLHVMLCRCPDAVGKADYRGLLPLHIACTLPVTLDTNANIHRIRDLIEVNPFTILCKSNYGYTPLEMSCRNNQSMALRKILLEKQQEAIQAIRKAFDEAMDALPFPDLVISKVWKFARPDVWKPRHDLEPDVDDASQHPVLPGGRRWLNVAGRR